MAFQQLQAVGKTLARTATYPDSNPRPGRANGCFRHEVLLPCAELLSMIRLRASSDNTYNRGSPHAEQSYSGSPWATRLPRLLASEGLEPCGRRVYNSGRYEVCSVRGCVVDCPVSLKGKEEEDEELLEETEG